MREQGYYWVKVKCHGSMPWFIAFFEDEDWSLDGEYYRENELDEIDEKQIVRG